MTDLVSKMERNVMAHRQLQVTIWRVRKARRVELRKPLPRRTCPGCFSAIYEGAAAQGWCCDCFKSREHYERDARLPNFAPSFISRVPSTKRVNP